MQASEVKRAKVRKMLKKRFGLDRNSIETITEGHVRAGNQVAVRITVT
jgi:uncharacterized tellurite resistance protein B-like protein